MNSYSEDDLLMLSGIQHMAFCERQWALIHIEQQWKENLFTVEGHFLHERVDDPFKTETRVNTMIFRAVPLTSFKLGLYGRADVIELVKTGEKDTNSITVNEKSGRWKPFPVEYKRGKPKPDERDEVQLCAQAMCLEEMNGITINSGFLYYGKTHHRHIVEFDVELRSLVGQYARRMHELFNTGITPLPVKKPACNSCSLKDICMPKALHNKKSASEYNNKYLVIT